ncbi:MAG: hypothetical protein AB8U62_03060 [Rickettsia aeschlimannii]
MMLKKIIRDCNEQFYKAWHFCKFEYSYSTLLSFEMPEEEAEKLERSTFDRYKIY